MSVDAHACDRRRPDRTAPGERGDLFDTVTRHPVTVHA